MPADNDKANLLLNDVLNEFVDGIANEDEDLQGTPIKGCKLSDNFDKKSIDSRQILEEEKSAKEVPEVGFFQLFRYSSIGDNALMVFAALVAVISGAWSPAETIIFGRVIDRLVDYDTTKQNYSKVNMSTEAFLEETATLCLYQALLGLAFLITKYIMVSCFSIAAANQVFRIRCMFMESILKQDIGWFDTNKTGDFTSRISGDLNKIQDGIGEKVPMCISSMSSAFLNVGCGFYYGWKLALVTSSVIPLLTIGLTVVTKIQATVSKEELDAYGTAGAVAEEVLSGIRTVVAFGGERKEIQRYDNHLAKARKKGIIRSLLTAISEAIAWLGIFCGYALAFWYGSRLILAEKDEINPEYSSGTLVIVLFTILSASMYSGYLSPYFEAFSLARGAAAKVFDVISRKSLIDSSLDCGLKPASLSGNITLKDVQFSYPARTVPVLKGLSFDVKSGQTVALVGPSGCGKSTVIQLILRFYDAITGY
ncbi:Multidrug resistance protein 1, partial [Stegodyphus mimosarum]